MESRPAKVLLIGYGNPGRLDDGLGPMLADAVARAGLPGVTVDSDYQLQVEDASDIAGHDVVIFADADVGCSEPFEFRTLEPVNETSFSTHSVSPGALMGMVREYFESSTPAYVLSIRGHQFDEFGEGLSSKARRNLDDAIRFILPLLESGEFEEKLTTGRPEASAGSSTGDE